jgi:PKD repeat protein
MKTLLHITLILLIPIINLAQQTSLCDITYQYEINASNQLIDFTNKSINGPKVVHWQWDFGDGLTSNLPNPRHVYMQGGLYIACLTIITEDGCENTFCDSINIGNDLLDTSSLYYSISGNVYAGSSLLPSGIVILLKKINNQYTAISFSHLNNGHYEFSQLNPNEYTVYCIPNFNLNINYYPSYFPTYFGDYTKCQNSSSITISNSSLSSQNIQLNSNTDILYGPDTISGSLHIADPNFYEYNIYCSNWFGNIAPGPIDLEIAQNMSVLLLNAENEPIRYAISDHLGNFQFKNLPIRIYKISPEKAGLVTIPVNVNMQISAATHANTSLIIGANSIYSTVQDQLFTEFDKNVSIYPNPAKESVTLSMSTEKSTKFSIQIENIAGNNILLSDKFTTQGNENFLIPLNNFSPGVYFVKIYTEGIPVIVRKIIKQ